MRNIVVYVSGPISKPEGGLVENICQAHDAGLALVKAGLSVIVPHGSCFFGNRVLAPAGLANREVFVPEAFPGGTTHEDWLACDLAIVERCDAVLRLPGESAGADRECSHARSHGIPVFATAEALLAWVQRGGE